MERQVGEKEREVGRGEQKAINYFLLRKGDFFQDYDILCCLVLKWQETRFSGIE